MGYVFGKQDWIAPVTGRCILQANGLGGYASMSADWSVSRSDQGILIAAVRVPNQRITMVHRIRERLLLGEKECFLSAQAFAGRRLAEQGRDGLSLFEMEDLPVWTYEVGGVTVRRTMAMTREENTTALRYEIWNESQEACTLELEPAMKLAPKELALDRKKRVHFMKNRVTDGTYTVYMHTQAAIQKRPVVWESLAYPEDALDGRPEKGLAFRCCRIVQMLEPGERKVLEVIFSTEAQVSELEQIFAQARAYSQYRQSLGNFRDPLARQLAAAADDFIVRRDSTNGKTILAGYPLFSDWGRDTMIALPGCCLATGRFEDAKSILRTFLAYEKDGLVPNLFPEGGVAPMYNTVDAALLLIDCVWQYAGRTEDWDFVREAWPVMERIIAAYRRGTHHSISMDSDGLIRAGGGLDQVTWMDVCIDGILPTPRHGKPVEINAYWYNALRVMDALGSRLGLDVQDYGALAEQVKAAFVEKFYMPEKGYLRDVISGTGADEQLRCNQIWAISMSFAMLDQQQERQVVQAVQRHLYTPCGLRSLSPEDPEFHGVYGGPQRQRDMAYHQGTVWVFPLGAYYLAWLKVHAYGPEACRQVRRQLKALEPMLREGCLGQLPEIYSGANPGEGKGCFAQAWSVGEMLRVLEILEYQENRKG